MLLSIGAHSMGAINPTAKNLWWQRHCFLLAGFMGKGQKKERGRRGKGEEKGIRDENKRVGGMEDCPHIHFSKSVPTLPSTRDFYFRAISCSKK